MNVISIATDPRVLLLADFITVYSVLKFGPNITNITMDEYCAEFIQEIKAVSNRTFDSCSVPDDTDYKPGNVVTMIVQSIPTDASGAVELVFSLWIIALSSVFMLLL